MLLTSDVYIDTVFDIAIGNLSENAKKKKKNEIFESDLKVINITISSPKILIIALNVESTILPITITHCTPPLCQVLPVLCGPDRWQMW